MTNMNKPRDRQLAGGEETMNTYGKPLVSHVFSFWATSSWPWIYCLAQAKSPQSTKPGAEPGGWGMRC